MSTFCPPTDQITQYEAECLASKRPDVRAFYQANGWNTGAGNLINMFCNWRYVAAPNIPEFEGKPLGDYLVRLGCKTAPVPTPAPIPDPTPRPSPGSGDAPSGDDVLILGNSLINWAKANPIPIILAGAALGMLVLGGKR